MPSFIIKINDTHEIRLNLTSSSVIGIDLAWVGRSGSEYEGFFCSHIGGVDGEERLQWTTPELSIGDEIVIKICEDNVVETVAVRTPNKRIDRTN
jgi:hypothetical protein